jgi:hypothetical protein
MSVAVRLQRGDLGLVRHSAWSENEDGRAEQTDGNANTVAG